MRDKTEQQERELDNRVRAALRKASSELWTDAAAISELYLTEGHQRAVFHETMQHAECVDAALRAGGWYCQLGHKHKLTETRCESVEALLHTAEEGL